MKGEQEPARHRAGEEHSRQREQAGTFESTKGDGGRQEMGQPERWEGGTSTRTNEQHTGPFSCHVGELYPESKFSFVFQDFIYF